MKRITARVMKSFLLIICALAITVGVVAYVQLGREGDTLSPEHFVTVAVEKGTLRSEITCAGTLRPLVEVLVGSQVSGTIKEVLVDFESVVKAGDLLALIDPALFEAKLMQAQADEQAAQADLAMSHVDLEEKLRDLKRQKSLFDRNSISESQFDTAKTKADLAAAQVRINQARTAQAEAKAKEARLQLDYTRIISPMNGVVIARSVDPGQTVAASFQAPVMFKIAEDLSRMQVHTNVDEADIGRVVTGQIATFSVSAFPDRVFNATVARIRNEPTVEQNVVTYNTELRVANDDLTLRPGMTAYVRILVQELPDVLMVPEAALCFTPEKKRKSPISAGVTTGKTLTMYKLGPDGGLIPIDVEAGAKGNGKIQIVSDALSPGDSVVVEEVAPKKKEKTSARSANTILSFSTIYRKGRCTCFDTNIPALQCLHLSALVLWKQVLT